MTNAAPPLAAGWRALARQGAAARREADWQAIKAAPRTPRDFPFDAPRAIVGGFMPLVLD